MAQSGDELLAQETIGTGNEEAHDAGPLNYPKGEDAEPGWNVRTRVRYGCSFREKYPRWCPILKKLMKSTM